MSDESPMRHISRIVWKPINWYPESPDQYPDGVPIGKPEITNVALDGEWIESAPPGVYPFTGTRLLMVSATQMGDAISLSLMAHEEGDKEGVLRSTPLLDIPADRLLDVVDALLYIHRRTREHDYQDRPWTTDEPEGPPEKGRKR